MIISTAPIWAFCALVLTTMYIMMIFCVWTFMFGIMALGIAKVLNSVRKILGI